MTHRNNIAIHIVDPSGRQLQSGQFVISGVVVLDGERLALMTRQGCIVRYELFTVPDAAAKWARVVQHAQEMLQGAFAPLDEFVGMLWADAAQQTAAGMWQSRCGAKVN